MPAMSSSVTSFGRGGEQPLLLHGALDEVGDVALVVADGADAVGDADVAHQGGEHRRQVLGGVVRLVRRAGSSSCGGPHGAAPGTASKVNRKASGAVRATDMPCGTIGSSAG